jgi:hypothetical protein
VLVVGLIRWISSFGRSRGSSFVGLAGEAITEHVFVNPQVGIVTGPGTNRPQTPHFPDVYVADFVTDGTRVRARQRQVCIDDTYERVFVRDDRHVRRRVSEHRGEIGAALLGASASAVISGALASTSKGQSLASPVPLGLLVAGLLGFFAAGAVLLGPWFAPPPGRDMSDRGLGTRADAVTWKALAYFGERTREHPGRTTRTDPGGRETVETTPDPAYEHETLEGFQREFGKDLLAVFDELERRGYVEADQRVHLERPEDDRDAEQMVLWLSHVADRLRRE